ncbi:hypothetical protein HPP92_019640 [Vanilla planifolia]|uniref:Uncharacterized protein n=1 Tax=Vanilla planifolia TaxID=51239 RepID=A0A835UN31_VANPL|nr:hypothetical protein HPP92_019640 [Vanilla planifolia]
MVVAALSLLSTASAVRSGYAGAASAHFGGLGSRAGSRFLADVLKNRDGDLCTPWAKNACPVRPPGNKLSCCNNHCRDVLSDYNNCGRCGVTCGFGELCCGGTCVAVAHHANNCGACGRVCQPGVRCEYGACGYA